MINYLNTRHLFGWFFCLSLATLGWAQSAGGSLSGTVSNQATRKSLEGALVEIPVLGLQTYSDPIGHYSFLDISPGQYQVKASYAGLEPMFQAATVVSGERSSLDFKLTSDVYVLDTFVVVSEREGNAASLTRQKNAPNVKNVVAMDALGYLANSNPGELLIRLPGITSNTSDEGDVFSINVRGIDPNLNSVTIDGAKMATSGGLLPLFRFLNINAAFFEELEVTKAPTPSMAADSLGGAVNMKTKTALTLQSKREFTYRLGGKWAPSFFDYTPRRRDTPVGPLAAVGYKEVFNVFGGKKNLGVSVDAFHTDNYTNYAKTTLDWQYTNSSPAYTYQHTTVDFYNNRQQDAINARVDYKLSDRTRIFVSGMLTTALEFTPPDKAVMQTVANASRSVATLNAAGQPSGNGAILPGYTDTFTTVRNVNGSSFSIVQGPIGFIDKEQRIQTGVEHKFGAWTIDYDASYSRSQVRLDAGKTDNELYAARRFEADLNAPVGYTIDQTGGGEFAKFTQTAGPSIYDIRNYTAGTALQRNGVRLAHNRSANLNLKRKLNVGGLPAKLSAGGLWQSQQRGESGGNQSWRYAGPDGVIGLNAATGKNDDDLTRFLDPSIQRDPRLGMVGVPSFNLQTVGESLTNTPNQWIEDIYLRESQRLLNDRRVREDITAAYLMGQVQFGRLDVLTGVRFEQTDVESIGWVRPQTLASITDPYARVLAEFGSEPRRITGSYSSTFPGAHLTYKIRPEFLVRASWSTSIGRPPGASLVPVETVNYTNRSVTVNNPALKPQYADNFDLSLEYYLKPVGLLSVGAFRKDISDFQYTDAGQIIGAGPDNGFAGQYEGFTLITKNNGGKAVVEGLEFSYQQHLNFLPSALKGFAVNANYTLLKTSGDYGTPGSELSTDQVAGFIPRSANAQLTYTRGKFKTFVSGNHTSGYLVTFATDPSRLLEKVARTTLSAGVSYRVHKALDIYVDVSNLLDEPQLWYRGVPNHRQSTVYNGPNVNFGISGTF